jgi:hypothetical protein
MSDIAPQNVTRQPRLLHMEVMNLQTGDVWLCQEPVTIEQFKAMQVAPPLMKSGCTTSTFDSAHFLRSPGAAADGPLETCTVDGRAFSRVARAVRFGGLSKGAAPTLVKVEKHHAMTFARDREVALAQLPDGQFYVQQTECMPGKSFAAPSDWRLFKLALDADWTLLVPPPVSVYFFPSLRSFQGPIAPGTLPGELSPT